MSQKFYKSRQQSANTHAKMSGPYANQNLTSSHYSRKDVMSGGAEINVYSDNAGAIDLNRGMHDELRRPNTEEGGQKKRRRVNKQH